MEKLLYLFDRPRDLNIHYIHCRCTRIITFLFQMAQILKLLVDSLMCTLSVEIKWN